MKMKCPKCGSLTDDSELQKGAPTRCRKCGTIIRRLSDEEGDASAAVGLIGGAALGAAIAGPVGALVGAIIGAILGKESKGVG